MKSFNPAAEPAIRDSAFIALSPFLLFCIDQHCGLSPSTSPSPSPSLLYQTLTSSFQSLGLLFCHCLASSNCHTTRTARLSLSLRFVMATNHTEWTVEEDANLLSLHDIEPHLDGYGLALKYRSNLPSHPEQEIREHFSQVMGSHQGHESPVDVDTNLTSMSLPPAKRRLNTLQPTSSEHPTKYRKTEHENAKANAQPSESAL
ncbi:hypothetical protein BDV19DRAFT_368378 [Aspergillus venezuelensis]